MSKIYNKETLTIGPTDAQVLETGVIRGKYIGGFAEYKLPKIITGNKEGLEAVMTNDGRTKVRRVLIRNGFNLKMYVQPPKDDIKASDYDDPMLGTILEGMYGKDVIRPEDTVVERGDKMYASRRDEILRPNKIQCDQSLFTY